ncbi:hypothetical protein EJ110_NYTH49141 [Nymphaea thermarum]|nr:hypothetical protein EJ110_NYTH49141 [Nymphaea thermarum]
MNKGMNPFVMVNYRQVVATLPTAPMAYFMERVKEPLTAKAAVFLAAMARAEDLLGEGVAALAGENLRKAQVDMESLNTDGQGTLGPSQQEMIEMESEKDLACLVGGSSMNGGPPRSSAEAGPSWAQIVDGLDEPLMQGIPEAEIHNDDEDPCVHFSQEAMQRMGAPYRYAVVAGLLGGSSLSGMDYSYVFEVLRKQWTMVRRPRFSVIGNGHFLIRVDNEEDICLVLAKRWMGENIPSQAHRTLHATGREHKKPVATSPQASIQTKAIDQRRMLQSDDAVADLVKKKPPQKNLEGQDSESHPLLEPSHGTPGAAAQRDIISLLNDVKPNVVFLLDTLVKETIIRSIALRTDFEGVASNQQQAEGIARIACFWHMGRLSAVQCQASRWWIELAFKIGNNNSSVKVFGVYLPNNPTLITVKKRLSRWNREEFGWIDEKVKSLYAQLEQAQLVIDQGNLSATMEESVIRQELNRVLLLEEIMWRNKSKNKIEILEVNGHKHETMEEMMEAASSFFDAFMNEDGATMDIMQGIADGKMVSGKENDTLLSPVTKEEVKQAVFGLDEDSVVVWWDRDAGAYKSVSRMAHSGGDTAEIHLLEFWLGQQLLIYGQQDGRDMADGLCLAF